MSKAEGKEESRASRWRGRPLDADLLADEGCSTSRRQRRSPSPGTWPTSAAQAATRSRGPRAASARAGSGPGSSPCPRFSCRKARWAWNQERPRTVLRFKRGPWDTHLESDSDAGRETLTQNRCPPAQFSDSDAGHETLTQNQGRPTACSESAGRRDELDNVHCSYGASRETRR